MSDANHVVRVRQMMQGFGQATPANPTMPPMLERMRCFRLLLEEVLEYGTAAGLRAVASGTSEHIKLDMSVIGVVDAYSAANLVDMVDACADISVVNTGAFLSMGIDPIPVLEEVDSNNLLKIETGKLNPITGKFEKHPDHPKPDFAAVIQEQKEQTT